MPQAGAITPYGGPRNLLTPLRSVFYFFHRGPPPNALWVSGKQRSAAGTRLRRPCMNSLTGTQTVPAPGRRSPIEASACKFLR